MAALRKTFKYPTEDDDSSDLELDEEHQEQLIDSLRSSSAATSAFYRHVSLVLPLGAALLALYTFIAASTARQRLTSLLSLSSLACTAYILYYMPIPAPDKKGKTAMYKIDAAKGPLERYLPLLNAGLVGLLGCAALLSWKRGEGEVAAREGLAGFVWVIAMAVRWESRAVDLGELEGARYGLKGA